MTDTTTTAPSPPRSFDGVVERYFAAWNETNTERRRALVDATWTPDGVYCDPLSLAEGPEAIDEMVAGIQSHYPDHALNLTSAVEEHHGRLRFEWTIFDPSGAPMVEGLDVVELADDGRFQRLSGFFTARPA
jgi:hypothetical protein